MRKRRRACIHEWQQILLIAGPAIGRPEHEVGCRVSTRQIFIRLEVDLRPRHVPAVRLLLAVRQHAVHRLQHHLPCLGRAIEQHQVQRRLEDHIRPRLGPSPNAALRHLGSAVVGRPHMPMPGRVHARKPLQPPRRHHRPLDVLRIAEVHHHRLAKNIQPVLVRRTAPSPDRWSTSCSRTSPPVPWRATASPSPAPRPARPWKETDW